VKAGDKKGKAAPKSAPQPKTVDQYADRSMQPGKTSGTGRGGYKTK